MPDVVTLSLVFPDGTTHDYPVKTFKVPEQSVEELEKRFLLLPFYALKWRCGGVDCSGMTNYRR
jgi:hypothetical protein